MDLFDLTSIDADILTGGDQAFTFITGGFSGTAGELRVMDNGDRFVLQGDVDGDGGADFAVLIFGDQPVEADFLL